jgi:AcrR family transcriptional regulator
MNNADRSQGYRRRSRPGAGEGGRPFDLSLDAAILEAALEGLVEVGYDRLSMDEIAARAHVGKGAIYRRWPSKAALVVEAAVAWRDRLAPLVAPDTGSLAGDFEALVAGFPDFDQTTKMAMGLFVGLVTAAYRDAELRTALAAGALDSPRRAVRSVLERAVRRGEVSAERDLDLVPEVLVGLVQLRVALHGQLPDRDYLRRVFRDVIYPLVTGPVPTAATVPDATRLRP